MQKQLTNRPQVQK